MQSSPSIVLNSRSAVGSTPDAESQDRTHPGVGREVLWATVAIVVTGLVAAARLLVNRSFYFADDSQLGSFGQWWQLGDRLLAGRIPVLDPQAWQAGNYLAEGQWGLLNPVTWLIALTARVSELPLVHVTIVKIVFLMLMAGGVYLLSRSFGASAPWAALAGVLVPMTGFTVYMDATSWTTGLLNAAVLPWVWWGLRRVVEDRRSPVPYLVASYVLVTFGYVFGVIILVVILVETLVRALIARDRMRTVSALAASGWGALLTVAIYLPGLLTAPVTLRAGLEISNVGFLNADLSDMAASAIPTVTATIGSWAGPVTAAPLVYIAWILPFIPLFAPMSRADVRRCIPLLVLGAVTLALVIGPSHIGPLRWPIRFIPYLSLVVVVLVAVMATRAFPSRITRRGVGWSLLALCIMTAITYANTPLAARVLVIAVIQAVALLIAAFVALTPRVSWTGGLRTGIASAGAIAVSAAMVVPQLVVFPWTPLPTFAVPDRVSEMRAVLADAAGDGIVVGDIYSGASDRASFDERLMGNLWYLSPTSVSSLYTVLPYATFSQDLCVDLRGSTCAGALDTLWSTDPTTGETVADLMNVSTIVAMKASFVEKPTPANGWRVTDAGEYTWLLARDEAAPDAGGVVWTADDTEVTVTEQSETAVTMRVEATGDDGRVVLSRLDYPGYSVDGAALANPTRGWLLTIDVSGVQVGDTVTVSFRPPGFFVMITAYTLCLVLLIAWPILRRRYGRVVSERAGSSGPTAAPDTRG